jgi:hypothetical protein
MTTSDGYRRTIPARSTGWLREWSRPLERGRDDGDEAPGPAPLAGHRHRGPQRGRGKTALATALALDLGRQGFSVVANTPLRLPDGITVRTTDRGLDAVLDVCMDLVGQRKTPY